MEAGECFHHFLSPNAAGADVPVLSAGSHDSSSRRILVSVLLHHVGSAQAAISSRFRVLALLVACNTALLSLRQTNESLVCNTFAQATRSCLVGGDGDHQNEGDLRYA